MGEGEISLRFKGVLSQFWEGDNLTTRIDKSMASGELQDVEMFVFTNNLVFKIFNYKEMLKSSLLFEIVSCMHQFQMKGDLILHVVNIAGTRMIESGIYVISRGNSLVGMMRGLYLLTPPPRWM